MAIDFADGDGMPPDSQVSGREKTAPDEECDDTGASAAETGTGES